MRAKNTFFLKFIIFALISSLFTVLLCFFVGVLGGSETPVSADGIEATEKKYKTVVIDAGHGGEDGGASSASGLCEKDVNLDISMMLADIFTMNGINVVMTRSDDRLLYDRNIDFHGRKKVLDLAARHTIAESTPDSILLSIHMNAFTDPRYSGLQVWYSGNDEESATLAGMIQNNAQSYLQPENNRKIKKAGSNIYLLDNATPPSVLVECGFLSNPAEAAMLESRDYRQQVAFVIFYSVMEFLEETPEA